MSPFISCGTIRTHASVCAWVRGPKKAPINPMQEVSGAWRTRASGACSGVFVQLGFLSGQ